MLLENTASRVISIGGAKLRKIYQPQESPEDLMPGLNDVDGKEWEKAKVIPAVSAMVKDGILRASADKADLSSMDPDSAIALVKKTVDRALLEKWGTDEKRPSVRKSIDDQLGVIIPKSAPDRD